MRRKPKKRGCRSLERGSHSAKRGSSQRNRRKVRECLEPNCEGVQLRLARACEKTHPQHEAWNPIRMRIPVQSNSGQVGKPIRSTVRGNPSAARGAATHPQHEAREPIRSARHGKELEKFFFLILTVKSRTNCAWHELLQTSRLTSKRLFWFSYVLGNATSGNGVPTAHSRAHPSLAASYPGRLHPERLRPEVPPPVSRHAAPTHRQWCNAGTSFATIENTNLRGKDSSDERSEVPQADGQGKATEGLHFSMFSDTASITKHATTKP